MDSSLISGPIFMTFLTHYCLVIRRLRRKYLSEDISLVRKFDATVPRGFLSLPMLSRCGHRQASATMHQWFDECFAKTSGHREKFQCMHWNFLPMFRRQIPSAIYTIGDKNVPDTSATHRRCSCKHRRCIFYVIISPMVWWSVADARRCSRAARRSIDGATAMLHWALEISFLIGHR